MLVDVDTFGGGGGGSGCSVASCRGAAWCSL